ncbi:hypothetical protein CYY_002116 [Polysphondylium violaceum]|uniref:Uncharacterized protein n=1 Tax=Polysphondylium violaceum TaxID=133409 RepID=A0A8J4PZX6_9MYCE|nr:hypothetical protein CYY_002116 [Polysphondylium violaceum]
MNYHLQQTNNNDSNNDTENDNDNLNNYDINDNNDNSNNNHNKSCSCSYIISKMKDLYSSSSSLLSLYRNYIDIKSQDNKTTITFVSDGGSQTEEAYGIIDGIIDKNSCCSYCYYYNFIIDHQLLQSKNRHNTLKRNSDLILLIHNEDKDSFSVNNSFVYR